MLKKMCALAAVMILALAFTSSAFAASVNNQSNAGGALQVDSNDSVETLEFTFSPQVVGYYGTEGTTTSEQWYAIATYHTGGNTTYGTAQNITSIYKQDTVDGSEFGGVPTQAVSASEWSGDWER